MMKIKQYLPILLLITLWTMPVSGEPVVLSGKMIPEFLRRPVTSLRIVNKNSKAIPFQVDEVTTDGEYVCNKGDKPNQGEANGILDPQDEIVFLWEDAESLTTASNTAAPLYPVVVRHGSISRTVYVVEDSTIPLSDSAYIRYDHAAQMVRTPYFYAQFGHNRFHFVKAGIRNFDTGRYIDLTSELRLEIRLKALWGIIPIRYTEENIVCLVQRYKVGPVRLIRRGDFHLNLGLGVKGSRAAVNQICYPQSVKVPVNVHVPIRFKTLFNEAYIEMTPVIRKVPYQFTYYLPENRGNFKIVPFPIDTLIRMIPNNRLVSLHDGKRGYGWVLQADMADSLLEGSGYVVRMPSLRTGAADCGYKLTVTDLHKGYYQIVNWVLFTRNSVNDLNNEYKYLCNPAHIQTTGLKKHFNRLGSGPQIHLRLREKN